MTTATLAASPAAVERDPRRWPIAYAVIVAAVAVILDGALLSLIAPSVGVALGADTATLGLITAIRTLMMAAFILGGGTLGDIYGRKRMLLIGLIGLIGLAFVAMLAPSAGMLIPVRAAMGVMAALINPMVLAIITVTFDADERPKALGLYGAALGISGGLGILVISLLNQLFGWRATFALDIVLGAAALALIWRLVPESKAEGDKRVDWVGIALAAAGLLSFIYGVNQAGKEGFLSPGVLLPVGLGVAMLAGLVAYSRRAKDPALRLDLFSNPIFAVGVLLILAMSFASTGAFFFLSSYLQSLQGVSPLQAALTLLPYTLSVFAFAILAGQWVSRFRTHLLITTGLILMVCGLAGLALFLSPRDSFLTYLVPLILIGAGFSTANTPRSNAVLSSAPKALAGSASATNNACAALGAALGVAVLGAIFQSAARNAYISDLTKAGLSMDEIRRSADVLSAWLEANSGDVAAQFGITVQQLEGVIANYENAYTAGVHQVLFIGAIALFACAVLAFFTFRAFRIQK